MRKVVLSALAVFPLLGYASTEPVDTSNAFDCMDKKSFEIDSACLQGKIEKTIVYENIQMDFYEELKLSSENAMATVILDPKTLNIEIIAHKDALLARAN